MLKCIYGDTLLRTAKGVKREREIRGGGFNQVLAPTFSCGSAPLRLVMTLIINGAQVSVPLI